jgi:ankyrin repeat protein
LHSVLFDLSLQIEIFSHSYLNRTSSYASLEYIIDNSPLPLRLVIEGTNVLHTFTESMFVEEILELLINCGCNVNEKNLNGESVLHSAVLSKNLQMIRILLTKGAYTNIVNKYETISKKHFVF